MKRQTEKPIVQFNAVAHERYQKAMREAQSSVPNPYDSEAHKEAQKYIKRRKLDIKALRNVGVDDD